MASYWPIAIFGIDDVSEWLCNVYCINRAVGFKPTGSLAGAQNGRVCVKLVDYSTGAQEWENLGQTIVQGLTKEDGIYYKAKKLTGFCRIIYLITLEHYFPCFTFTSLVSYHKDKMTKMDANIIFLSLKVYSQLIVLHTSQGNLLIVTSWYLIIVVRGKSLVYTPLFQLSRTSSIVRLCATWYS